MRLHLLRRKTIFTIPTHPGGGKRHLSGNLCPCNTGVCSVLAGEVRRNTCVCVLCVRVCVECVCGHPTAATLKNLKPIGD